jgi:hypothetical protein
MEQYVATFQLTLADPPTKRKAIVLFARDTDHMRQRLTEERRVPRGALCISMRPAEGMVGMNVKQFLKLREKVNRSKNDPQPPGVKRQKPRPCVFVSGLSTVKSKVVMSDNELIDAHTAEQEIEAVAAGLVERNGGQQ